ncbi:hypothetical protein J6590_008964 [Homalodisca vitripennis]|nr:hypothetical protein J6590_008964 [Homalodisca vitripennis]
MSSERQVKSGQSGFTNKEWGGIHSIGERQVKSGQSGFTNKEWGGIHSIGERQENYNQIRLPVAREPRNGRQTNRQTRCCVENALSVNLPLTQSGDAPGMYP